MAKPGEDGGDCPECGETTTMIGYENCVLGAYCEACSLLISLGDEVTTLDAMVAGGEAGAE